MIILDHDDDSKDESNYNGRTVRHPSVAYTRDSSSILPPYEPYSYPPQSQVSLDAASATTVSVRKVRFYRNRRVWKISGIAFAVYIALTLIIALPILVHEGVIYIGGSSGSNIEFLSSFQSESIYLVGPLTGNMSTMLPSGAVCNAWSSTGSHFQAATFTVPSSVETISIRSNVTQGIIDPLLFNGSLSVSLNTNVEVSDVQYLINITASDAATLKQMDVCFSNSSYGGGLSLYIPDTLSAGWLRAEVQLILPVTLSNRTNGFTPSYASYKPNFSLSTFLPMLQQTFNLPWSTVTRRVEVKIEGASAPINITHLDADSVSISNLLAPVTGNFYVRDSLDIRTIKGSIEGDITMPEYLYSILALSGESSPITATVKFADPIDSDFEKPTGPMQRNRLSAKVTTSNAPLTLDIRDIRTSKTVAVDLQLTTRNYFEETRVTIGPTFECNFAASSKLSKVNVKDGVTLPQNDPTGANRPRVLKIYKGEANSVEGSVSYETQPSAATSTNSGISRPYIQGSLTLENTMSPIYLNFAP